MRKPGFHLWKTNVGDQRIDNSRLEIFDIVIASFLINDKNENSRFLKEMFLLADISMGIALGILFLILSNVKVNFGNQELK